MISVIIPTFNEEKYLETTLKALRNQSYAKKFEIIVADGGSRDRTVRIARKYADKVVVTSRGVSKGRNAGALVSKGDVLVFIDADTVPYGNALNELESAMRHRGVVGATCPVMPMSSIAADWLQALALKTITKLSLTTKRPVIPGICIACRRDAFERIGGFDESINVNEDADFVMRLRRFGKIGFAEYTFVLTSTRRIQKWGRAKSMMKWIKINLKHVIFNEKTSIREYRPCR